MIAGDLATMSLADLLQWADVSQREGVLEVEVDGLTTEIVIRQRTVLETTTPPPPPVQARWTADLDQARAIERLLDLFLLEGGRFQFHEEDEPEPQPRMTVDMPLRLLVMEGIRTLDEWQLLDKAYSSETARIGTTQLVPSQPLSALQQALLDCAERHPALGEVRLTLGLSRPALLRRVEELHVMGLLSISGFNPGHDPVGRLIRQALALVREAQYDEASIVLRSLLEADPSDVRLRRAMLESERQQVASLYEELDPLAVASYSATGGSPGAGLSAVEREVLGRVNGRSDVSALVLACSYRELETLKALRLLAQRGLVSLQRPDDGGRRPGATRP